MVERLDDLAEEGREKETEEVIEEEGTRDDDYLFIHHKASFSLKQFLAVQPASTWPTGAGTYSGHVLVLDIYESLNKSLRRFSLKCI